MLGVSNDVPGLFRLRALICEVKQGACVGELGETGLPRTVVGKWLCGASETCLSLQLDVQIFVNSHRIYMVLAAKLLYKNSTLLSMSISVFFHHGYLSVM